VACGGAGPLHAVAVARALGCALAYVPRLSGAFCALGMLNANVRHDFFRMHLAPLAGDFAQALQPVFAGIESQARDTLRREGFGESRIAIGRALDLRYRGQQWDITVDIDATLDAGAIRASFEAEHGRLFGHVQPGGVIEITKARVNAIGVIDPLPQARHEAAAGSPTPRQHRNVWIDAGAGWRDTPVYEGHALRAGHVVAGPAIVDEQTTTLLIGDGDRLVVDASGNYRIEIAA
jgi:N-methylhydantoinase A